MTDDIELLRRYAGDRDETAFADLVARRVSFVYAAALRQLGGAVHRAEDVTQAVFIRLARGAGTLSRRDDLMGWLYTTTHHVAANLKRTELRRQRREEEANPMQDSVSDPASDVSWERLRPVLDDALLELGEGDRRALLLRFFEQARFADVAQKLGVTEGAARMRVERALDKLRALLARRGITSTSAALASAFTGESAVAAPVGLVAAVTGAALAGAAGGTSVATTGIFMSTKSILAAAVVVGGLGLATYQFDGVSRLAGEVVTPGARSAAVPPPPAAREIGANAARPTPAAAIAHTPTPPPAEPAPAPLVKLTSPEPGSAPAARGPLPPIVLSEVLGPDNSYRDDAFGLSATFPAGWKVRSATRAGENRHEAYVMLDAGVAVSPTLYYRLFQPDEPSGRDGSEAYLRDTAAKKEAARMASTPDYRNVPESFAFTQINGAPAMSYAATFTRRDKVMIEYFIRIVGQQGYAMFYTTGELEAVQPAIAQLQQTAKTVRLP